MKHIHIDKAIGGTNDGAQTPYLESGCPQLAMIKKRPPLTADGLWYSRGQPSIEGRFETEDYRLERFCADDCVISFWLESSMSPAAAMCHLLLRYAPKEDVVEV